MARVAAVEPDWTLVIWGDQDAFVDRAGRDRLAKAIPHATVVDYPAFGHAMHWEDPARVASFFANVSHLMPESRARVAASLAAEVAPFVSPLPDAPPERFLAAVVALRRERDLTRLRLEEARMASLAPQLTATPAGFPRR